MKTGLGRLGWAPPTFWQATPREVVAALGPPHRGQPDRVMLNALMARYPDIKEDRSDGS